MVISLKVFFTPFAFLFWVQVGELGSNLFDVGLTTDLNGNGTLHVYHPGKYRLTSHIFAPFWNFHCVAIYLEN
mgnify:CR=1 FL=1